ncbi:MAG: hypothetical protein GY774_40170 [Planctomycetes bacterium]|nr:hypothetical protein [Planctomycetota bacterium]
MIMEGPDGIHLDRIIGVTERGTLWRALRQSKGDRIVRIINPQFCDLRFRQSLGNLCDRQYPRMIPVVGEGWAGVHFYVEYRMDSAWETLEAYFQKLHWRMRLPVLSQICEVLTQWKSSPVHPLGLNGYSIVMVKDVGRWFPWLLPCPALPYGSACDFFGVQPSIISVLAPELIRGVHLQDHPLDSYALGTLAIYALGGKLLQLANTDEKRIEAQACSTLLQCEIKSSEIEDFLYNVESLRSLIKVIQRYTHVSTEVRPIDASELRDACMSAFDETRPGFLASLLARRQNSREALKVLQWGFDKFSENLNDRLLAADICEKLEERSQALVHLDRAVLLDDSQDLNLLWRRCRLRWLLYQSLSPLEAGEDDPEGALLLNDTIWLKSFPQSPTDETTPYLIAASVYRRRQELTMTAKELYTAAQDIDQSDMMVLWLYGECLRDLDDRDGVNRLVDEAHRRLERMTITELMEKTEAERWCKEFDALLQP